MKQTYNNRVESNLLADYYCVKIVSNPTLCEEVIYFVSDKCESCDHNLA